MGKGLDYDELFPGRFLKSGQFQGKDVTLTIAGVRVEKLPQENGQPRGRGIIAFQQTKLELVLNRTNGECLKAMFGRDSGEWVGKRVTFFPAKIEAFGEEDIGIRIRGSPDLPKDMPIEVHLARRKPIRVTMKRTGKLPRSQPAAKQETAAANEPEPGSDAEEALPFENGSGVTR